jgi:predicted transposase/invertase (TIGR01784 family)
MKDELETIYVNPLTDFGFNRVFAQEKNKDLLIHFLNTIIGQEKQITDIEYLPASQFGYLEKDRKAVFDIFCKNKDGERFIVEMQRVRQEHFVDRSLFYSAFPILKQAPKGKWNFELKAVYTVAILDFVLFNKEKDDKEYYIEKISLTRERTKKKYSDKLNLIFVELPKFTKKEKELSTDADYWLYSLKHAGQLDSRPAEIQGPIFKKLFETLQINQLTEEEMGTYEKSVLEYRDVRSALKYRFGEGVKEGAKKGVKEGFEKGFGKGIEKGDKQGFERGDRQGFERGANQNRIEIAKNCIKEGMSIEMVARVTGLSAEQLQNHAIIK